MESPCPIPQYLSRRAADWKALDFTETLTDFPALNARSKSWGDDQRAAFKNWEEVTDPRNALGGRQGVEERIMPRELLRRVGMMVMLENRPDALVRLHTPLPPGKIGGQWNRAPLRTCEWKRFTGRTPASPRCSSRRPT
jgi:amidase